MRLLNGFLLILLISAAILQARENNAEPDSTRILASSDSKENKSNEISSAGNDINRSMQTIAMPGLAPIHFSGFGDIQYNRRNSLTGSSFGLGQFELDMETSLHEKVDIATGIAYDNESGSFFIGTFVVSVNLREFDGYPSVTASAGQFDVPVGHDWQHYASPDRPLVSAPLVVDYAHGQWNDLGAQLHLAWTNFRLSVFMVNGDGCSGLCADIPDENELNEVAFGARTVAEFPGGIEWAVSAAQVKTDVMAMHRRFIGSDITFNRSDFELTAEVMHAATRLADGQEANVLGYYFRAVYDYQQWYLVGRYDSARIEADENLPYSGVSLGLGYRIVDGCELRLEQKQGINNTANDTFLQLLVRF
jgi:hypothetical protein